MITTEEQLRDASLSVAPICVCCGRHLTQQDEFCSDCQTPASLSRTVASRSGEQNFVSVLGASNAGKTVYLGLLLDILSKGSDEFRGTASNSSSIDLQEQVVTALERRSFPEKTPSEADGWKWMHCQVSMAKPKTTHEIDLISPDFAGEAIAMEIQRAGMYPAIQHVVEQSVGLMVLCDSMRVRDEGSGEDLFAMKLASYVAERHGLSSDKRGGRNRPSGPAIAIVFTKCDGCPEAIEDPSSFAANNTPRLYEFCRRTFANHEYFAASVAGSSGILADSRGLQMQVPFHTQPRGVVEPLQWIVTRS
jgi:hypothetical protein